MDTFPPPTPGCIFQNCVVGGAKLKQRAQLLFNSVRGTQYFENKVLFCGEV
uniref:Uncharacterized protein n=1 Tax=Anguilla anguilla TaxID=7936 RepID=A0A0E9RWR7_ANGAN